MAAIVGASNALFLILGLRDIFFPGTALPMPDDDKLVAAFFGPIPVGDCGKKAFDCLPGKMLMLSQLWGVLLATVAATKLTCVLTNPEGTFLRRNLFLVFGVSDLLMAYLGQVHGPYLATQGASVTPFCIALGIEGAALLHDALTRDRAEKKRK